MAAGGCGISTVCGATSDTRSSDAENEDATGSAVMPSIVGSLSVASLYGISSGQVAQLRAFGYGRLPRTWLTQVPSAGAS